MNKIIIYTNKTCPYCKKVKDELTENKIEFDEVLIGGDKNWQSIVDLTGMPTVPTIYFKGEYLVAGRDFGSPEMLVKRIQKYVPSKYTTAEITLEKLKTLNHNISMAFNRTNQLLVQIESKLKIEDVD
tara:strand:- start:89 stop:472 length:384 start_codon:yes stop_codon:yes gene_type:complete